MKRRQVRKCLFCVGLTGTAALCVFLGLAVCGKFTDNTVREGQNVFGGIGPIQNGKRIHSEIYPMFYDTTDLYYVKDESGAVLYAYNWENGKERSVCTRVLCRHNTPDCTLYCFYDNSFLYYWEMDNHLYYTENDGERITLYRWDVLEDKSQEVFDFPAYHVLTDESGEEFKINDAVSYVERINPEMILVTCGGEIYLFDNNFVLQRKVFCGTGINLTWSGDRILWERNGELCCYQISSDSLIQSFLSEAYGQKVMLSSMYFYCYDDIVFCTIGNKLMEYDFRKQTIKEVTELSYPIQVSLLEQELFYRKEEKVFCLNLETKELGKLPEVQNVPRLKTDKYFIESNALRPMIYTHDGKAVHP